MRRLRFTSGLTLGLALGVPAGALIALLILPPRADNHTVATSLQVDQLTRKLEEANGDRQRMQQQLEQFQKLADQMTASFNTLEARFKALEEEQRVRAAQLTDTGAADAGSAAPRTPTAASGPPAAEPPDAAGR